MKTPELEIKAQNLINRIINKLDNLDSCRMASDVIDYYEETWPNSDLTQNFRDRLCNKTFEIYFKEHETSNSN